MQLKTDGTAWAWGQNDSGNLAQNDTVKRSSPVQIGTDTNWGITNAHDKNYVNNNDVQVIKTDGTLWKWGQNYNGALGLNNASDGTRSSPHQIGTDTTWSKTAISRAIKTNGTLWTWGFNQFGQLGLNDSGQPPSQPDAQRNATSRSSPTQVGTNTTWAAIADTGYYMYAVKTDGTLWSWGRNNYGVLGQNQGGTWPSYGVPYSSPKQVGSGTDWKQDMRAVTAANESCAGMIKTDGTLYMVGANGNGNLGQNDTVHHSSPVQVPGTTWSTIDTDYFQSVVATKTDGTAWAWGTASNGQLGQNERTRYSSPVQISGTWSSISTSYNSVYGMKSTLG